MKKRIFSIVFALVLVLTLTVTPVVAKGGKNAGCTTIQDGVLTYATGHYLEGELLQTGYDPYGYNYQGHMFNGSYANVYLGRDGFPPYEGDADAYVAANPTVDDVIDETYVYWYWPHRDVKLVMKWNDAWLSNKDCDDDGLLDRHYGYESPVGSGAWETNHQSGSYVDEEDGKTYKWNYFVKIVAVPADAYVEDGYWYTADDVQIGPVIWGSYARVLQVYSDQGTGDHPIEYLSPAGPGFGKW